MRDSFTLVRNDDAGGNIAIDVYTGENVDFIAGIYPPPILPDRQCPGCPAGMTGGIAHDGEWYCWPHFNVASVPDDAWQDMGDYYTGPTYMEYDEESW